MKILTPDELQEAAAILLDGGLVAFPTETVYGLGADATNPEAVERIYAAKGRPSTNPLIVHVDSARSAPQWASIWSPEAEALAVAFWPGPLTLVVPANPAIAPAVRAGGSTVGLRVPAHAVALALLRLVQRPIAAPSANRSNRVSPTRAEHVVAEFGDRIDAVLDGGACAVGIESTVCEITAEGFRILRPGAITEAQIRQVTGQAALPAAESPKTNESLPSPGMLPRHYAPHLPLLIKSSAELERAPVGVVVIHLGVAPHSRQPFLPAEPSGFAAGLYSTLRWAETVEGASAIWLESPPKGPDWDAIWDRLRRASTDEEDEVT